MKVTAKAPINIALIKYWGKEDEKNVVPYNDSISLTLDCYYTETSISSSDRPFQMVLNGVVASMEDHIHIESFLNHFEGFKENSNILIESKNTGPTAAGLASSASGFAALSVAANRYFKNNRSAEELASITKLGSGSASRSLLGGFVQWHRLSTIEQIESPLQDVKMIIVLIDTNKKEIASKVAMKKTVETSPLYPIWIRKSREAAILMREALEKGDFQKVGQLTEESALLMHATMYASTPAISYIQDASWDVWNLVHELRKQQVPAFCTMDAGPNVKIITRDAYLKTIIEQLKIYGFLDFVVSGIGKKAEVVDEN